MTFYFIESGLGGKKGILLKGGILFTIALAIIFILLLIPIIHSKDTITVTKIEQKSVEKIQKQEKIEINQEFKEIDKSKFTIDNSIKVVKSKKTNQEKTQTSTITENILQETSSDTPKLLFNVEEEINSKNKANVILFLTEQITLFDLDLANEFTEINEITGMNAFAGILTKQGFDQIKNNPNIISIELDLLMKPANAESFPLINQDQVVNQNINGINIDGTGQTVCIIDTGVGYGHPELGGCTGTQFINGNCNKTIGGWDFFNSDANPADDNGHGTAIAGLIAANGSTYKGIAPGAKIFAVKIADASGNGWTSNLVSAINLCVNNATQYNITTIIIGFDNGASYTGNACDGGITHTAVNNANQKNMTVYAPSGNGGFVNGTSFPSCITPIISVGGVRDGTLGSQWTDTFWQFSNRDSILDLLAPGFLITSLTIPSGTANVGGTSFAAAHVAGTDILIRQYNKEKYNINLIPSQIENIFKLTGKNITDDQLIPNSNLTFPRIDLLKAVNYETIDPVINLISPIHNSNGTENVTFNYTVTDHHEITSCSLYLDGQLNQTNTGEEFNLIGLSIGNHTWQIKCWDNATFPNQGSSNIWNYEASNITEIEKEIEGTVLSCEYGPMNGGELGENKCVPDSCPSGFNYLFDLNEHHISGKSHYNRVYRQCAKEITNSILTSSESGNAPACPGGMTDIGLIEEIHAANTIQRNYRVCMDSNEIISGEITSCKSSSNTETTACTPPVCSGNKTSLGTYTDIRPIFSSHNKNRNWWFIGYRICVE